MPKSINAPVNPDLLKYARNSLGIDPEEVSERTGYTVERLLAWEQGEKITMGQVKILAKRYRRPPLFFFLPELPIEMDTQELTDFRVIEFARYKEYSPNLRYEIRYVLEKREELIELFEELELQEFLKPTHFFKPNANPEKAGDQLRKYLGLNSSIQSKWRNTDTAFRELRQVLERHSVLAFNTNIHYARKIDLEEMRGFAISKSPFPIIGINSADKKGKVFSLAHEFFHILMGHKGVSHRVKPRLMSEYNPSEIYCNHAAGAFLVPHEELMKVALVRDILDNRYAQFSVDDLFQIARSFGVSRSVISRRLHIGGFITDRQFQEHLESIGQLTIPDSSSVSEVRIPGRIRVVSQNGKLYTNAVITAFNIGSISLTDATRYLNTKTSTIHQLRDTSAMIWDYLSPA